MFDISGYDEVVFSSDCVFKHFDILPMCTTDRNISKWLHLGIKLD